ncbi:DUF2948 family protein [Paracoccus aerodenitrificans]|uniref:DUF2948 family protein n=1 Tax=Paracoccus aerodenitrificans TaxID=3017781 RepID=UPI0022F09881|nr:DUF2948 family protein [Paracoccus aerodenitrificans]WBU65047.1 DUF2948 family protein [Paracoccus aerodenitrificans]
MNDASFHDADPGPLMLRAEGAEDVSVLSMLVQDAVLTGADITFDRTRRQLTMLINRFRWEDAHDAEREGRDFERVRALLVVSDITGLRSDGIDRGNADEVLSLLALVWQPGADGTGRLMLEFAGDGTIAVDAECVSIDLRDVTRPYIAPSGHMPRHDDA